MANGNGVAQTRRMVVFEDTRPIRDCLPVKIRRPKRHLDTATLKLHGKESLPELPILEAAGAPDFLKELNRCLL